MRVLQEAAERYADTSWKIHQDWYTNKRGKSTNSAPPVDANRAKTNGVNINNNVDEVDHYAKVVEIKNGGIPASNLQNGAPLTKVRKVVEIQTVQTTCESVKAPADLKKNVEVVVRNYLQTDVWLTALIRTCFARNEMARHTRTNHQWQNCFDICVKMWNSLSFFVDMFYTVVFCVVDIKYTTD